MCFKLNLYCPCSNFSFLKSLLHTIILVNSCKAYPFKFTGTCMHFTKLNGLFAVPFVMLPAAALFLLFSIHQKNFKRLFATVLHSLHISPCSHPCRTTLSYSNASCMSPMKCALRISKPFYITSLKPIPFLYPVLLLWKCTHLSLTMWLPFNRKSCIL